MALSKYGIMFFIVFIASASNLHAQKKLEEVLSSGACNHLEKIDLETINTEEQKKNVLSQIFAQAARDNEKILKEDIRFKSQTTYEQGKKIGIWLSQFVMPIMIKDCPKFLILMSK